MAVYKILPCKKCEGLGWTSKCEVDEFGGRAWNEPCNCCKGTGANRTQLTYGQIIRSMTNEELGSFLDYLVGANDFQSWLDLKGDVLDEFMSTKFETE